MFYDTLMEKKAAKKKKKGEEPRGLTALQKQRILGAGLGIGGLSIQALEHASRKNDAVHKFVYDHDAFNQAYNAAKTDIARQDLLDKQRRRIFQRLVGPGVAVGLAAGYGTKKFFDHRNRARDRQED